MMCLLYTIVFERLKCFGRPLLNSHRNETHLHNAPSEQGNANQMI